MSLPPKVKVFTARELPRVVSADDGGGDGARTGAGVAPDGTPAERLWRPVRPNTVTVPAKTTTTTATPTAMVHARESPPRGGGPVLAFRAPPTSIGSRSSSSIAAHSR